MDMEVLNSNATYKYGECMYDMLHDVVINVYTSGVFTAFTQSTHLLSTCFDALVTESAIMSIIKAVVSYR